jgi:hypothetical protein
MNDLRHLLLDCRAALRRADATFELGPLRPRLDQTIIAMSTAKPARESIAEPQTFAAQQVAYAWQQAARELTFTHPALHAELGERVRERLQSGTLVDPGIEIVKVQQQLRDEQAAHEALRAELAAVHATLAAMVALDDGDARGSESERAQRRLQRLLDAATRGDGLPRPRPEDPQTIAPTTAVLHQVRQGARDFTRDERDWCIGEAMVRTHFERDPSQLLAGGDRALAALLLDGAAVAG